MPAWLTVIIAIFGLVSTIFGIFGVSAYISERVKHRADIRNQQEDTERVEFEAFREERRKASMREVLKEEIDPLKARVEQIEKNTEDSLAADVLALRCNMKALTERVKNQGYADIGDKATMHQLRAKYEDLGGNNFREYVNHWCEVVEILPNELPNE